MSLIPGLDEILKIANKFIPDKDAQIELQKKTLEVNEEIIKGNKTLLEKVVPITFPLCVWIFLLIPTLSFLVGLIKYLTTGTFYEIPLPWEWLKSLFQLCMVFVCGLVGKWNIEKFFDGKNNNKKE
ncbi:hypothetical protein IX317_000355 [Fusobacterium sp. DD29]|uniref:hypothetical protein n=1 Tax=unclassified Fusobacterium TaxID=2648384 RepID=UPI001B8D88C1|nr:MULTISPECIES: hypothetical protein [unclassified Fusobacterium]MBR8748696.1 hypothetical protein [Fusobacterium sp. DD29]MBR8760952.1 hypothetical protein [Fusobacterium sp. DD25]MBR8766975.1 hypothetical protein [Fusobacterium sp. DD43]MBR8770976.1 hypothetical protein [Fusobacterium sp. DD40]MBR8775251.1 hypothetical protein [Fusobacterium sp. DD17]